jgi:hypothetical protein
MGAWGEELFENDSALDWINEYTENQNIEFLKETIELVIDNDDFLDIDYCIACLCAVEVISLAKNGQNLVLSEDLSFDLSYLKDLIDEKLIKKSLKAVKKILKSEESEYIELMSDEDEAAELYEEYKNRLK